MFPDFYVTVTRTEKETNISNDTTERKTNDKKNKNNEVPMDELNEIFKGVPKLISEIFKSLNLDKEDNELSDIIENDSELSKEVSELISKFLKDELDDCFNEDDLIEEIKIDDLFSLDEEEDETEYFEDQLISNIQKSFKIKTDIYNNIFELLDLKELSNTIKIDKLKELVSELVNMDREIISDLDQLFINC